MTIAQFIRIMMISLWISLLLTQIGCLEEPIELGKKEKILVDTLAIRKTKMLRIELDSICDETFDTRVAVAVDSILAIRKKQIDEIINRK